MGQLLLFSPDDMAAMRDRTRARKYSPEAERFRHEHERHRAWGLTQRHAAKLRRLYGSTAAAEAAFQRRVSDVLSQSPEATAPVVAEPVVAEPVVAEPVVAEPVVADPDAPQQGVTEPVADQPGVPPGDVFKPAGAASGVLVRPVGARSEPFVPSPVLPGVIRASPLMSDRALSAVASARGASRSCLLPAPVSDSGVQTSQSTVRAFADMVDSINAAGPTTIGLGRPLPAYSGRYRRGDRPATGILSGISSPHTAALTIAPIIVERNGTCFRNP